MIAGLLDFDPSSKESVEQWAMWHMQDHLEIKQAIQTVLGTNLIVWDLYPFDLSTYKQWALRHQSAHNEMNSASSLPGSDLQEVDFNDREARQQWHETHFREHNAQRQKYGI